MFVKVVDFGISKVLKAATTKLTMARAVVGHARVHGAGAGGRPRRPVDHRSDQWALAVPRLAHAVGPAAVLEAGRERDPQPGDHRGADAARPRARAHRSRARWTRCCGGRCRRSARIASRPSPRSRARSRPRPSGAPVRGRPRRRGGGSRRTRRRRPSNGAVFVLGACSRPSPWRWAGCFASRSRRRRGGPMAARGQRARSRRTAPRSRPTTASAVTGVRRATDAAASAQAAARERLGRRQSGRLAAGRVGSASASGATTHTGT